MWFLVIGGLFLYVVAHLWNIRSDLGIDYDDKYTGQYMMLSAIPMTVIRWVSTGKHFWNKP